MKPVTGQIQVKTKYRECSVEQCNIIRDKALRGAQKILVIENPQCVKLELHRDKPNGKITFVFDITFMSDSAYESEPVQFTYCPVHECFERAVRKALGAKKPTVKTYTATLRIRKDVTPVISFNLQFDKAGKATLKDTPTTQEQREKAESEMRELVAQYRKEFGALGAALTMGATGRADLIRKDLESARTPARTTGMPPCMATPYGRTKTVNGHEVPRGITLDELNAMVQGGNSLTCEIWYVAPWAAQMVHHTRGVSTALCRSAELGTAHLTRDAAVRHAMALFIPEKLEKPEDERTDIYESARDALMRDLAAKMKRVAAIRISNLRRNIKKDNDALKMIAPDGKTVIVNGHLVQRGITRAEYDAMPVKPADLWLVRLHSCGDMVFRSSWLSEITAQHMDLGLVHLDREDAACHARALFTPDALDVVGGDTNA